MKPRPGRVEGKDLDRAILSQEFTRRAPDQAGSFAKLRAGAEDRQEISPTYLHLVRREQQPSAAIANISQRIGTGLAVCKYLGRATLEDEGHG
jgi:hypothetical protein